MDTNNEVQNSKLEKRRIDSILVGTIFILFGLICVLNVGPVGQFFFYITTFLFGVFCFLPYVAIIAFGILVIIGNNRKMFKYSISVVGVILFLLGFSIAASNSRVLVLSNMMDEFKIAYANIELFHVENYGDTVSCGGGFLGYLFAALLNSALTYGGTIAVYVILILVGVGLFIYNPIVSLVHYFKDFKYVKRERKFLNKDKKDEHDIAIQMEEKPVEDDSYDKEDSVFLDNHSAFESTTFARPVIAAEKAVFNHSGSVTSKNNIESSSDQKDDDLPKSLKPINFYNKEPEVKTPVTFNVEKEEENIDDNQDEFLKEALEDEVALEETVEDYEEEYEDELESPDEFFDEDDEDEEELAEEYEDTFTNKLIDDTFSHTPPQPVIKNQNSRKEDVVDDFVYPSIDLLNEYEDQHIYQENFEASVARQIKINDIFKDFSIGANVSGFKIGPSVTRFEIQTNKDVSVNAVSKYIDDVSVRLGGEQARFEKVVRGSTCSGLEIPNKKSTTVSLKECLAEYAGKKEHKYRIPLGKDITGNIVGINFIDFPHLLVAGSTGSGKSIFMHNLIMSVIMKTSPKDCRIMLIDPKHVEMSKYKDMPHLMCPILNEINPTRKALNKLVQEMENRYNLMQLAGVSKLSQYNEYARENGCEELPYILVIIDEYADLVESYKDISTPVVRLAQKSRACGIHLVISTQRPSVNVITGVIKANLPTRVALRVASPVDSMTILGEGGAEKLLGNGDLLVDTPEISGGGLTRLQSPYVDNSEIRRVVSFLKDHYQTNYYPGFTYLDDEQKTSLYDDIGEPDRDDRFEEVKEWVLSQDEVSKSFIQRKFGFGFNRAARIIDILEEEGYVVKDPNGGTAAKMKVIHKDQ